MTPISRRLILSSALSLPLSFAAELKGGIKLTMPGGGLSDEALNFIAYLGVEWVTSGGPGAPTYDTEGRVVRQPDDRSEAPWKEEEIRKIKQRVESFGLKVGNLMLHDFRDAILGAAGGRPRYRRVCESIRVAGKAGIPVVEYNWYALRAMGGYYREPDRGGSRLAAHDYDRSRDLPPIPEVGGHSAADLWTRYERFLKAVVPVAERAGVRLAVHPTILPRRSIAESSRSWAAWTASGGCARLSKVRPTALPSTRV